MTKKSLVTILAFAAMATTALAQTKYGIWIGGVEVTSNNAQNFTKDICPALEKGTVEYDERSKTLTLKDAHISKWGDAKDALANTGCPGLTIRLEGKNSIFCITDCVLRLEKKTTIECTEGSSSTIIMRNYGTNRVIYMNGADLTIQGSGKLFINAASMSSAGMRVGIEGKNATETLTINGPDVIIQEACPALLDLGKVIIQGNGTTTLEKFGRNSRLQNVKAMSLIGNQHIVWPTQAAYDAGKKSITVNGTPVTEEEVVISGQYILLNTDTHIPDANFRAYLKNTHANGQNYMYLRDAWAIQELDVSNKKIATLKGIEYFKKLKTLKCQSNQLTELDVSGNTELTTLNCFNNQLTKLNLKFIPLTTLQCFKNQLKTLDVSFQPDLSTLYCYNNQLTKLDVSKNTNLSYLDCSRNQLKSLDVSKNTALLQLFCSSNQLETLDLSKNTVLNTLYCHSNKINRTYMQKLVESLTDVNNGRFMAINTKDDKEQNFISPAQVNLAKNKGWNVLNWNGPSNNAGGIVEFRGAYSIAAEANQKDYGTVTGAGSYEKGKAVTLKAVPNKGYLFKKWVLRNTYTEVSQKATYSFTATADQSLIAVFEDEPTNPFDLNKDGKVDVGDVTTLVSAVLSGNAPATFDLNNDKTVDVGDVTLLVSTVLSSK